MRLVNEIRKFVNGDLSEVDHEDRDLYEKYNVMDLQCRLLDLAAELADKDGVRTELVKHLAECHRPYEKALELLAHFDIHPKP